MIPPAHSRRLSISELGNTSHRRSGNSACASIVPLPLGFRPRNRLYLSRESVASSTRFLAAFKGWVMRDMSGTAPMYSSRPTSNSDEAGLVLRTEGPLGQGHFHAGRIPFGKKDAEKGLEFRECTRCCCPEGVVRMGAVPAQRPVGVQGQAVASPATQDDAEAKRQFVPCGPVSWLHLFVRRQGHPRCVKKRLKVSTDGPVVSVDLEQSVDLVIL